MEIKLSSNEFKALSSETRTGIMKLLKERNHTLSELSEKLDLAAPTIKQHLEKLENTEMVEQLDSGHKWKYYTLTKKGKTLIEGNSRENSTILIVLGFASIAMIAILFSVLMSTGQLGAMGAQSSTKLMQSPMENSVPPQDTAISARTNSTQENPESAKTQASPQAIQGTQTAGNAPSIPAKPNALNETMVYSIAIVLAAIIFFLLMQKKKK